VTILEPVGDGHNVSSPDVRLLFRVKSAAGLKRLELVRAGAVLFRQAFDVSGLKAGQEVLVSARLVPRPVPAGGPAAVDLSKAPANADGAREVTLDFPIEARDNVLRVEAVSEGGAATPAEVVVNYVPLPVWVVFEKLDDPSRAQPVEATHLPGGRVSFPAMGEGRVELRGYVAWNEEGDERLRQAKQVRVYVNGFQQPPAELLEAAPGSRQRRFTARLILSQPMNKVEIQLPPECGQDVQSRPYFELACKHPLERQQLYLLVISPKAEDLKALEKRALAAFKTKAFVEPVIVPLIGEEVNNQAVLGRLGYIRRQIARRASEGATNDVVMVYYTGADRVDGKGHYLKGGQDDPDLRLSGISCEGLVKFLPDVLGAQMLFLDVTHQQGEGGDRKDLVQHWPPEAPAVVLRAGWLDLGKPEPPDAQVLTAWQKTTAGASLLKEVVSGVGSLFRPFEEGKAMRYDKVVPASMENIPVGGG
jgi:hypothetical protein